LALDGILTNHNSVWYHPHWTFTNWGKNMKTRNSLFRNSLLLPIIIFLLLNGNAQANDKLELWVHPYLPATELIKKFSPLATYLGEKIGQPVQVKVSKSYRSHAERIGEGRMDLAYLGPASYVKITHMYGKQTILACLEVNGSPFFHGMVIARQDSPVKTPQDLVGKKFAFGDPNSTMSHLVPRFMLWENGVSLEKLKQYEFLGSHHNVVLGVLGGYYDAGGIKEGVYYEYKDRGLNMIAKSPPIAEHLFVANKNLPEETINSMRKLLLNLKDKTILSSIKKSVTGMASVKDEDYESLRAILKQFDKLSLE
jgi:phosphonate transport system substrate-binding protein